MLFEVQDIFNTAARVGLQVRY